MAFGRGKKKNKHGLMALAGGTAKLVQNVMVLDTTEARLEKELKKEEGRILPTSKLGKARHKGEVILHSKHVLLMIVTLNIIDCLLVLGELMLDVKYVADLLTKELDRNQAFIGEMRGLHMDRLGYLGPDDIDRLEYEISIATISWHDTTSLLDSHGTSDSSAHGGHGTSNTNLTTLEPHHMTTTHAQTEQHRRRRRASGSAINKDGINGTNQGHESHNGEHAHAHSVEEDIAHGLHKASITILGILVVETIFKIFCFGKEMVEHKLECFDSVVVVASFIVDLVLLKGLQQFSVQEFVLILAFLVPWRIIRVVNSLVVAIMDHEHFRLKLLYKQKKKVSSELKESKDENKGLEACIDVLQKMCEEAGIPDTLVKAKLNIYRKVKGKTNAISALSNFAMGAGVVNNPFPLHIKKKTDVVITVGDTENNRMAKTLEDELKSKISTVIADLANNTLDIFGSTSSIGSSDSSKDPINKHLHIERRPRSRSALDINEMDNRADDAFLNKLAENSVGFIATINTDEAEQKKFDKDDDGYITAVEIRDVFLASGVELTDEDMSELIAEADENGDGVISFDEFSKDPNNECGSGDECTDTGKRRRCDI